MTGIGALTQKPIRQGMFMRELAFQTTWDFPLGIKEMTLKAHMYPLKSIAFDSMRHHFSNRKEKEKAKIIHLILVALD